MSKIYNWLVKSSVDPEKYAMTIKGAAVFIVPLAITLGKHFGYAWSDSQIAGTLQDIGLLVATILTLFGLVRKIVVAVDGFFKE